MTDKVLFDPEAPKILGFQGPHRFLSNFWPAEVKFAGHVYPTVEHAYQAAKSLDETYRAQFRSPLLPPGMAKRLARTVKLRPNWNDIKVETMTCLVMQKFDISGVGRLVRAQRQELVDQLKATGESYLEETNTWKDTFWGVCNGKGENRLGLILMNVRWDLNHG